MENTAHIWNNLDGVRLCVACDRRYRPDREAEPCEIEYIYDGEPDPRFHDAPLGW